MSTLTTLSSSPSLTVSTPPTSPSSTRSPTVPYFSTNELSLSTSMPALNRALLRAYNLALAYTPTGTPQYRKLTSEAAQLAKKIEHEYDPPSPEIIEVVSGAPERKHSFKGWEERYPNFGKHDPPVLPPAPEKPKAATKKRDVEIAGLDEGNVEAGEKGGKRVRRMSEKAREKEMNERKVAAHKRRKTT